MRPLRAMTTATWRPIATLQAGDKQEIHDFEVPIRVRDKDCSAWGDNRHDLRMSNAQSTSVREVDVKRLKRSHLVHGAQLLDSHDEILRCPACVGKHA